MFHFLLAFLFIQRISLYSEMYNYSNASSVLKAYYISFHPWKCIVVDKLWECIFYMNWQIQPRFLMIRKLELDLNFSIIYKQEYF